MRPCGADPRRRDHRGRIAAGVDQRIVHIDARRGFSPLQRFKGGDGMRAFSMAKRIIRQVVSDKRTLALLLVAPVFAIYLLNVIFNSAVTKPILYTLDLPPALVDSLKNEAHVTETTDAAGSYVKLKNKEIDALLTYSGNKLTVTV